jgi:hypothetical protein
LGFATLNPTYTPAAAPAQVELSVAKPNTGYSSVASMVT